MILQSLISDASCLSIDCAKTKITRGMIVELPDNLYWEKEIQNAIKLNFIKLVGDIPEARPIVHEVTQEKKIKLICNQKVKGRIAFDCIKDVVQAGQALWVPESKMSHPEIQNAVAYGILEDPENNQTQVEMPIHKPVSLDEVKATDEEATSPTTTIPVTVSRNRRRQRQVTSSIKAKKVVSSSSRSDIESEDSGDIIGGESKIISQKEEPLIELKETPIEVPVDETSFTVSEGKKSASEPEKIVSDQPFSFLDIFGENK